MASFDLQMHNPDVLTCIANLSNDEVFTPPELANQMLDTIADAWADSNDGANIWADPSVTFLDPFTKSGVFLREIVRRLVDGLAEQIPDQQQRVDHVLSKQVFGIGITQLTSLLARRSVYCSKQANGKQSIATVFDSEQGNIWFERTEHTWEKRKRMQRVHPTSGITEMVENLGSGRCKFCGAAESEYLRGAALETHAYAFIHTDNIKARIAELFGADMQFDVIIGNPPYQLSDGGAGASSNPIYHRFVQQAKKMEPRYLVMVMPSRWMAGGRGLEDFRSEMLNDPLIAELCDFPVASEVFGGIEIKGGVCYFVRNESHKGLTRVSTFGGGVRLSTDLRKLNEFDVFVRESRAERILHKVLESESIFVDSLVSPWRPYGWNSDFSGYHHTKEPNDLVLHYVRPGKRLTAFVGREKVVRGSDAIDTYKLFAPEAYGAGEGFPHQILGKPILAKPGEVCTGTYIRIGNFDDSTQLESFRSYYCTKFFRFLVSLRKITQHTSRATYAWVPMQSWDRVWTDASLYEKYGLTDEEILFVEGQIKPMEFEEASVDA